MNEYERKLIYDQTEIVLKLAKRQTDRPINWNKILSYAVNK